MGAPGQGHPGAVGRQGDSVDPAGIARPDRNAVRPVQEEAVLLQPPDADDLVEAGGVERLAVGAEGQAGDRRGRAAGVDAGGWLVVEHGERPGGLGKGGGSEKGQGQQSCQEARRA